ncbi:hypothetical protein [Rhodoplanes elegans]|uniref:hypothetical protein n=1 Tax=Rhodoplanes elegans TaxID=29408 RepID=UPI0011B94BDF|nr:hypothetical protein [Rhodoplanes elegans]
MSQDYYVIGIDVMSYSQKRLEEQVHAQDLLDRTLATSLKQFSLLPNQIWIDGGDGGYLLLTGEVKHIMNFLEHFFMSLGRENNKLKEENRAPVRCAIHYDSIDIRQGELGPKYTGNAINVCSRLLSGMNRTPNQVVCSANFRVHLTKFNDHLETITRLKDIVDKHGNHHPMYNLKRNNLGTIPASTEVHPDPVLRFDDTDTSGK